MGGTGSGYPLWMQRKTTVEECLHLEAVWFNTKKNIGKMVTGDIAWTDPRTGIKMSGADFTLDLRDHYQTSAHIRYRHRETGDLCSQEISLMPSEPFYGGLL
ncbi:hypothetical protein ACFL2P_00625 [Candidatus Moduliflexota bacterium]